VDVGAVPFVVVAGLVAGAMNAVVGGGSLVTFPVLVAAGLSPLQANVSNNIGVLPGSLGAVYEYRYELRERLRVVARLASASAVGGLVGGLLLLSLPARSFEAIVPVLLVVSALLTLLQPRIASALAHRRDHPAHGGMWLLAGVALTGVYGGYFGAAQGVILLALLGALLPGDLQVANAVKNVLALVANLVAALLFSLVADVDWGAVAAIALGSVVGGVVGARFARRLPVEVLRLVIVVAALVAAGWLALRLF
jgi:uncharacterized membrane protein YfcA